MKTIKQENHWIYSTIDRINAMDAMDHASGFVGTKTMPIQELLRCVVASIDAALELAMAGNTAQSRETIEEAYVMSMMLESRSMKIIKENN